MAVQDKQIAERELIDWSVTRQTERILAKFSSEAGHTLNTRIANVEIAMTVLKHALTSNLAETFTDLENAVELLKSAAQNAMRFGKAWREPKFAAFSLTDLLAVLKSRYRPNRFAWTLPRNVNITGDSQLIEKAIIELLDNARRFAPARGGKISVKVCQKNRTNVRRTRQQNRRQVVIDVRDNGPGIPNCGKESIFLPYHSSDRTHFGLGLSIVRRIVESHGGTVNECGRVGMGANFKIVLPQ